MIYYLAHHHHCYTFNSFLAGWPLETASRFEVISYRRLFHRSRLPAGTYIFTDIDRLAPDEQEKAARAWNALGRSGGNIRLLNHPLRAMRRYELLRTLQDAGINDFNIYRLTGRCRPERFPVFIRGENDHAGPETPLLKDQAELDAAVEGLLKAGKTREGRVAIEFCAVPSNDGLYRKYAAFVLMGEILPRHVMFSTDWVGKRASCETSEALYREEQWYVENNPHAAQLNRIPQLARIDYGRIDYGVVDGRVQAYEINTNPTIGRIDVLISPYRKAQTEKFHKQFIRQLLAIDLEPSPAATIPVRFDPHPFYWRHRHLPYDLASVVSRIPFLKRYGPHIYWYLTKIAKKLV